MTVQDLAMLVALVVCSLLFVGCGNEALRINAGVAHAMLEVQSESGPLVRQLRIDASIAAAQRVHDSGGDEAAAQAAARTERERWQCALDTHRIYSDATGAYIDTIALWQAGLDFQLLDGLPFVQAGVSTYGHVVSCLTSLGSDALPALPAFLQLTPPTLGGLANE